MFRSFAIIPVVLFMLLAGAFGLGLTHDPKQMPSLLVDRKLPRFDLPPLPGHKRGLSSDNIRGGVTLVNVYASWCGGCRYEHPVLMNLALNKSVGLVGISWKDKPGRSASWIEKNGNPYTDIGDDENGRTGVDMGVTGVPETFVVDHDGRVRYRHAGPLTMEFVNEKLMPLIEEIGLRASTGGTGVQ